MLGNCCHLYSKSSDRDGERHTGSGVRQLLCFTETCPSKVWLGHRAAYGIKAAKRKSWRGREWKGRKMMRLKKSLALTCAQISPISSYLLCPFDVPHFSSQPAYKHKHTLAILHAITIFRLGALKIVIYILGAWFSLKLIPVLFFHWHWKGDLHGHSSKLWKSQEKPAKCFGFICSETSPGAAPKATKYPSGTCSDKQQGSDPCECFCNFPEAEAFPPFIRKHRKMNDGKAGTAPYLCHLQQVFISLQLLTPCTTEALLELASKFYLNISQPWSHLFIIFIQTCCSLQRILLGKAKSKKERNIEDLVPPLLN